MIDGQFTPRRLVVGVTSSTVSTCPKGRAGFLDLFDGRGAPDSVTIKLCGHLYTLEEPAGSATVSVVPR